MPFALFLWGQRCFFLWQFLAAQLEVPKEQSIFCLMEQAAAGPGTSTGSLVAGLLALFPCVETGEFSLGIWTCLGLVDGLLLCSELRVLGSFLCGGCVCMFACFQTVAFEGSVFVFFGRMLVSGCCACFDLGSFLYLWGHFGFYLVCFCFVCLCSMGFITLRHLSLDTPPAVNSTSSCGFYLLQPLPLV